MKVGIVKDESHKYDGYNWHDIYAEEFKRLGDSVILLDFNKSDWLEQLKLESPHFLLWRAWHRPDDRDDAKVKIYFIEKELRIPIFPNWNMYSSYDNKILQNFILNENGFKMPQTWYFRSEEEALTFAELTSFPIISKCSEGACGDNVRVINTKDELKDFITNAFSENGISTYFPWVKQKGYVYLQEYLNISKDLRVITIGDKVELAYWRENAVDWKKNISAGGSINTTNIPKNAIDVAIKVAQKLNFHWCAIDLCIVDGDVYIFEFSSIFGFSKQGNYMKHFGSPNANILKKQVEYLHRLFRYEN